MLSGVAGNVRMIGALRQKRRALLERPWSSTEASACSWDQCGAFWMERERLCCVEPGDGLSTRTVGVEVSSGCSGALEAVGRLGFARGDSQEALGALRIGCDGLQRWEYLWFCLGAFGSKVNVRRHRAHTGNWGLLGARWGVARGLERWQRLEQRSHCSNQKFGLALGCGSLSG